MSRMETKKTGKGPWIYWSILLNQFWILLYFIGLYQLTLLCQYGGVRRRGGIMLTCAVIGIGWMIAWSILYRTRRRRGPYHPAGGPVWKLLLIGEIVAILVGSVWFGSKIVYSAQPYNGKLAWKIDEWTSTKTIELVHDNVYEDGLEGIFTDISETITLPEELYLVNQCAVDFAVDGTITKIDTFFYGKDRDGEVHTYLVDYRASRSSKMTVYLDNNASPSYDEAMLLTPMLELIPNSFVKATVTAWSASYIGEEYELLYRGYRDFNTLEGLVPISESGEVETVDEAGFTGTVEGYEVSLYMPANDSAGPLRLINLRYKIEDYWERKESEMASEESSQIGTAYTDADGSMLYMLDEKWGWKLIITDAAAGSRFYQLEQTEDGGSSWVTINENPFLDEIGVACGIIFDGEQNGYIGLSTASGELKGVYKTADGGVTFERVEADLSGEPTFDDVLRADSKQ